MKDKNNLNEQHLEKIKYRFNYAINETPKYRPMIKDESEFDELPDAVYSTPKQASLEEVDENPQDNEEVQDLPDENAPEGEVESPEEPVEVPMGDEPELMGEPHPEEGVDELQNDIIKHNIQAMKDLNDKIKSLDSYVNSVNTTMSQLSAKVKEVEEPTNAEKLMSKKEVSYPFYFNLPDVWKGNWFDQQREQMQEKGIKQLPDGTYIADFDDLPKYSDQDIESSFNNIV
ncbi:MAG: hypothetical protein ACOC33_03410 [bacterium]